MMCRTLTPFKNYVIGIALYILYINCAIIIISCFSRLFTEIFISRVCSQCIMILVSIDWSHVDECVRYACGGISIRIRSASTFEYILYYC